MAYQRRLECQPGISKLNAILNILDKVPIGSLRSLLILKRPPATGLTAH